MKNIETHSATGKKMLRMVLSDGTEERNSVKSRKYKTALNLYTVISHGSRVKAIKPNVEQS